MLSLNFICNNSPMGAVTASSGTECSKRPSVEKEREKNPFCSHRDPSCLEKPNR